MSRAERDSGETSALPEEARPSPLTGASSDAGLGILVRCAGRTAVGQVRDHNEDNFVVANLGTGQVRPRDQVFEDELGDRGLIFAVCDGMGGAAAGEVASQMAVDILVEAMRRGGPPQDRDSLARRLVSAVEEAGRRIFDSAQRERSRRGMGTTATVAVLVDRVMFLAEVGDSRAYLLRQGDLRQLTKDQSLVNQLIEAGHLTEDEAEAFEHSNIILQALGTSETVQVDLTFVELRRGDRLLLCSDGLSGLLHLDTLRTTLEELKDPAECSAKLIEYAETAGGHDNITVVVADFDGDGLPDPGDGDTFGYVQYPLPMGDHESSAFAQGETVRVGRRARVKDDPGAESAVVETEDREQDDSLLPLGPRGGDKRGTAGWLMAGAIALAIAGGVWFRLQPPRADDPQEGFRVSPGRPSANPGVAQSPPGTTAATAEPAPEVESIEVNIHTDVEHAILLVNGEPQGELSSEQSRSLKLRPGAYRFEAQSAGTPVAASVVTVRGDLPLDVFLQLHKGASESAAVGGAVAQGVPGLAAAANAPPPGLAAGAAATRGGGAAKVELQPATSPAPPRRVRPRRREHPRPAPQARAPSDATVPPSTQPIPDNPF
jgi:PPM family protein phosphatase